MSAHSKTPCIAPSMGVSSGNGVVWGSTGAQGAAAGSFLAFLDLKAKARVCRCNGAVVFVQGKCHVAGSTCRTAPSNGSVAHAHERARCEESSFACPCAQAGVAEVAQQSDTRKGCTGACREEWHQKGLHGRVQRKVAPERATRARAEGHFNNTLLDLIRVLYVLYGYTHTPCMPCALFLEHTCVWTAGVYLQQGSVTPLGGRGLHPAGQTAQYTMHYHVVRTNCQTV